MARESKIEFIEIDSLIRSLKDKYKFETRDRIKEIVSDSLSPGVSFKNKVIKTVSKSYFNKVVNNTETRYFFKCPQCSLEVRKIFSVPNLDVGCRHCCKIKNKKSITSKADRVIKIQQHMHALFNGQKLTTKQKNKLTKYIVDHYNMLDEKYKLAYNTFIFKELQNWCFDMLVDKTKSSQYKSAIKDVLEILKSSKTIMVKTGMVKGKEKDFDNLVI